MEAKVDAATQDVDAFSQGGPAMETPTAIADRMHALLVIRANALEGCTEGLPEETRGTGRCDRGLRSNTLAAGANLGWKGLASQANRALGGDTQRAIAREIVRTTL